MDFNEYQALARRTQSPATAEAEETLIDTCVLGVNGEAGEVADIIKKFRYHGHELDKTKLIEEIGDILWYCACGADGLQISLEEIAMINIRKLTLRYPDQFSTERSLNRDG